jgi:RNA polymerase sigma-70 factor, ECF subfamily
VQDVYLRWHETTAHIQSPLAFLITVTSRLCLDRLRERKQQRAEYVGLSVAEPIVEDYAPSPEAQLELTGELSAAFVVVLERLSPAERATFLLYDVFDYDYQEVAQILCKSEQSCRQAVHRARAHLRELRARFRVTAECRERSFKKFLVAVGTGHRHAILSLLVEIDIAGRPDYGVDSSQAIVEAYESRGDSIKEVWYGKAVSVIGRAATQERAEALAMR